MTPGALWLRLRRDWQRGFAATYADYRLRPRIRSWQNPHANLATQACPVHVLCGSEQLDMCVWMLASWTTATARNWSIVIHDDGSLPADAGRRFAALGLSVCVVGKKDADKRMEDLLVGFPRCAAYRSRHALARKVLDVPCLTSSERFVLLDTDLLFFRPPAEVLAWADRPQDDSCWFNADVAEASNVTASEALLALDVALWPKVNSGLCLLQRNALSRDFCEDALARTKIMDGHIWRVEQTLIALCASRWNKGGLLPPVYEVSLGKSASPECVVRHYVGAVRERFWGEGVRRLAPALLR